MLIRKIRELREPPTGKRTDWLHVSHGKFPDFAAHYENWETGGLFTCAVWEDPSKAKYICAVEGPDEHHFGILHSYLWRKEKNFIRCRHERKFLASILVEIHIDLMEQIALKSLRLYATRLGT